MAFDTFIPRLWAAAFLSNLNNDHVYAQCFNRDYEGEVKGQGSSVTINSIGRVTINAYSRNTNIGAVEELDVTGQSVLINQGDYFNFGIDDIDKKQAAGSLMSSAMAEASWAMAEEIDDFLAGVLNASVATANTLSARTVGYGPGESDAYSTLVEMQVALDDANVPGAGRWVVVPNWYGAMLNLDPRVISFGTPANRAVYRGDPIGTAAGFTIMKSNNVPSSTDVIAGYKGAATYAEQLHEIVPYKPELRFGDAVKGLQVYGAKVTRPSALAKVVATQGAF